MEKLSIEEKAKRYDEAIERAKGVIEQNPLMEYLKKGIEYIFPELVESEDERIRKELIEQVVYIIPNNDEVDNEGNVLPTYQKRIDKYRAWLEKQGEHKKFRDSIQVGDKVTRNEDGVLINLSQLNRVAKPADKVEPKSKVGDWVVCNNGSHPIFQVIERSWPNAKYRDIKGTEIFLNVRTLDKQFHLWTIQDAKDGDVLADGNLPFIFKKIDANKYSYAYCGISVDDAFRIESEGKLGEWTWMQDIKPATKEQRHLLFQKMKEAGYEWDAEKKELKKIEQKPSLDVKIPFGAKDSELEEVSYNIPNGYHAEVEDNKVVIKRGEKKPTEWSEDDEKQARQIERIVHDDGCTKKLQKQIADWLKSIKSRVGCEAKCTTTKEWSEEDYNEIETIACHLDNIDNEGMAEVLRKIRDKYYHIPQSTWKPSEEEMKALEFCIEHNIDKDGVFGSKVVKMYNELKKLMEE